MKLSIIIPCFNVEKYINKILDSLLAQNLGSIEVILVNDGSTDKTLFFIKKREKEFLNIKVINQKNKGAIDARKTGMKLAIGQYISFLDADDWLGDDFFIDIDKLISLGKDLIIFNYKIVTNVQKEVKVNLESEDLVKELLINNLNGSLCNKIYKRTFLVENNINIPKGLSFAEDLAFLVSIAIYQPTFCYIDKYYYFYQKREGSTTNTLSKNVLDVYKASKFIKEELLEQNLYEKYKEEYEYCCYLHNFKYKFLEIFDNNIYSSTLYDNWIEMNINIYSNKYFNEKIDKFDLIFKIVRGNTELCKFISKIYKWKGKLSG